MQHKAQPLIHRAALTGGTDDPDLSAQPVRLCQHPVCHSRAHPTTSQVRSRFDVVDTCGLLPQKEREGARGLAIQLAM
jgi:hypothetical protein